MQIDENLYALFARHVAATPDAVAIVEPDGTTTSYAALAEMACRVEAFLEARRLEPEAPVGVLMHRTPATVAVLLGILKAGGCYVPVEAADPARRQRSIVRRAGVELLLHDEGLADAMLTLIGEAGDAGDSGDGPPITAVPVADVLRTPPGPAERCAPGGHRLCYVLFTSGSTGEPKGVEIEQRSVVNLLLTAAELLEFGPQDCYLAAATIAFDISVAEIFMPLVHGARFLLRDRTIWFQPAQLADDIRTHGVTVVQSASSTWAVVLAAGVALPRLRVVINNAEALPPELAPTMVEMADHAWNLYGPTETTIWSTAFRLTHETIRPSSYTEAAMAIGQPMANQGARVVAPDGRREVTGSRGELFISGVGLARGYRGDPGLTAQRFVTFADSPKRFYASGDEAGWSLDGDLLFYGRVDDQMKIRGNRVDPAEVEAVINEHPAVRRAAVTWFDGVAGRAIVAAVQRHRGALLTAVQLHRWLEARLSSAMIPSRYLMMDDLPLSPNGKLDRVAIRAVADQATEPTDAADAVSLSDAEEAAAVTWRWVLQVDAVHPDDHFFIVGGDSLAAVMVLAQVETMYGVVLPVTALFEAPTLAEFALVLDDARRELAGVSQPSGRSRLFRRMLRRGGNAKVRSAPGRSVQGSRVPALASESAATSASATPSLRRSPELPLPFDPAEDVIERLRVYVEPWQGHRHKPDALIVTLNEHGTKPALFWCFQGHYELAQLAGHLGAEQPVHGMRSGHLMIDHHDPTARWPIVEQYVREIQEVQPAGPLRLGGNCQAALIMHETAERLQAAGREIDLLILMEQSMIRSFDGHVALLFGRNSHLNPFNQPDADPHASFGAAFSNGYTVRLIDGAHGQFFDSPNIETFAGTLGALLGGELDQRTDTGAT